MYKTCRIAPGKVSLKDIAKLFELDPAELRWFHNRFCPEHDLIDPDIQAHVEVIYIPVPGTETGYYKNKKRSKPLYRNPLSLENGRKFEKMYGIMQKVQNKDGEKEELYYSMKVKKKERCRVSLMRKEIFLNQKRPDMVMEKIADEVGSIFYPLELELFENGMLKFIDNFPDIQQRWKAKKHELLSYYKGEVVKKLIDNLEDQFEFRGKTQRGIVDSLFFVLYFFPLYEKFTEDGTCSFSLLIPVFPKGMQVRYKITMILNEEISDEGKFMITAKGIYTDSDDETEMGADQPSGTLDLTYCLNALDNSISSIVGTIDFKMNDKEKILSFECYETED